MTSLPSPTLDPPGTDARARAGVDVTSPQTGRRRPARRRVACAAVAVAAVVAPVAAAGTAEAAVAPQWSLRFSGAPSTNAGFSLYNEYNNQEVRYGSRDWGINLVWSSGTKREWRLVRPDNTSATPRFGEALALYNATNGQYVRYGSRSYGINLVWSSTPSYQWRLKGGSDGTAITSTSIVALYNDVEPDSLVYGSRPVGINLVWADDGTSWKDYACRYYCG